MKKIERRMKRIQEVIKHFRYEEAKYAELMKEQLEADRKDFHRLQSYLDGMVEASRKTSEFEAQLRLLEEIAEEV